MISSSLAVNRVLHVLTICIIIVIVILAVPSNQFHRYLSRDAASMHCLSLRFTKLFLLSHITTTISRFAYIIIQNINTYLKRCMRSYAMCNRFKQSHRAVQFHLK